MNNKTHVKTRETTVFKTISKKEFLNLPKYTTCWIDDWWFTPSGVFDRYEILDQHQCKIRRIFDAHYNSGLTAAKFVQTKLGTQSVTCVLGSGGYRSHIWVSDTLVLIANSRGIEISFFDSLTDSDKENSFNELCNMIAPQEIEQ